jgi:hypothetical protein
MGCVFVTTQVSMGTYHHWGFIEADLLSCCSVCAVCHLLCLADTPEASGVLQGSVHH